MEYHFRPILVAYHRLLYFVHLLPVVRPALECGVPSGKHFFSLSQDRLLTLLSRDGWL